MLDLFGRLGGCAMRTSPGGTWRGNPLQHRVSAEPGFAVSGDVLVPLLGQKGGAAAGKILLISRTVEELGASWCGQATVPYGLGQELGAWLLVLGS